MQTMKASEKLCRLLIQEHLKRNSPITSWNWFAESREWGIIGEEVSQHQLLCAMSVGKKKGWLKARWLGVGLTPYAGSARRQRFYDIANKARKELLNDVEDTKLEGKERAEK